jgi:hypothetical protein
VFGVSHPVRAMIEKLVFLDGIRLRGKVVRPLFVASIMALTSVAGFRMLVVAMVGTIPELPIATRSAAPVPFGRAEAKDPESNRAPIERPGSGGITAPTAATQVAKTTSTDPGEWLIDDVAKARARPEVAPASPDLLPATAATASTRVEARAGSGSPDDTRTGADEHVPGADTSRRPDDGTVSCIEAHVGQASEREHRYYGFDREDHRKCRHVRARRHEAWRRSGRHSRSGRTWANWNFWSDDW